MKCRIVKQMRVIDNANTLAPRYVIQRCSKDGRWEDYMLEWLDIGYFGSAVFRDSDDALRFTETPDLSSWDEVVWECEDESKKE